MLDDSGLMHALMLSNFLLQRIFCTPDATRCCVSWKSAADSILDSVASTTAPVLLTDELFL